jgi:hypothetical protein
VSCEHDAIANSFSATSRAATSLFHYMMNYFTTSFNPSGNRLVNQCLVSQGKVTRTIQVHSSPLLATESVWAVGSTSPSTQFVISYQNLTVERYSFQSSGVNETFSLDNSAARPLLHLSILPTMRLYFLHYRIHN